MTREDHILRKVHDHRVREPGWSPLKTAVMPFWLAFPDANVRDTVGPTLTRAPRGPATPTLSPDIVVFQQPGRKLSREIARQLDGVSRDNPDTYHNLVVSQEEVLPSLYNHSWTTFNTQAIPCLVFRGLRSRVESAAMARILVADSVEIFTDRGLQAPLENVPQSLLDFREIQTGAMHS